MVLTSEKTKSKYRSPYTGKLCRDLTGSRNGRLVALYEVEPIPSGEYRNGLTRYRRAWMCECDCGNKLEVLHDNLLRKSSSCGCYFREQHLDRITTHNLSKTLVYDRYLHRKAEWERKNETEYMSLNAFLERNPRLHERI